MIAVQKLSEEVYYMKNPSRLFSVLAIILSHIMCIVVSYNYRDILCGIDHAGFSAPADMAFLYAIPFLVAIALCAGLSVKLKKK